MARKKPKAENKPRADSRKAPQRLDVGHDELQAILERTKSALSPDDHARLAAAVDTLAYLTQQLETKGVTIAKLRKLIFGPRSEKTRDVLAKKPASEAATAGTGAEGEPPAQDGGEGVSGGENSAPAGKAGSAGEPATDPAKKKRKGHGRNGADDYVAADRQSVPHGTLQHKDLCSGCGKGKVHVQLDPAVLVRVRGVAPLNATVYELERLRCSLCGEVFTADSPPGVGYEKYDATAAAMMALLKYGCGLPFYRIERLGNDLGIPLPSSTQWEVVEKAARTIEPAWAELVRTAAQGSVLSIDDTKAKVLELNDQLRRDLADGKTKRSGVFTSGVVSRVDERHLALFFTGNLHAGENLAKVLAQRSAGLKLPIQMGDASPCNTAGDFETLVASCLAHARRNFVDVVESFPDEVRHVLEQLRQVYHHDAQAREQRLSDQERLSFHQEHSAPVMEAFAAWLEQQFDERRVEPNSSLGGAIKYFKNHWSKLTLFLREPGAPLDNNLCERALKKAILHRKNALFYKTSNGAFVGDLFMSLIHTAELCGANPFEYLVALQRHRTLVESHPADWMPWNYQATLVRLGSSWDRRPRTTGGGPTPSRAGP